MTKKAIQTDHAPKAIGPYSQGILKGGWLFVSGQIPIDPATGEMIRGDIKKEATQALENLKAVIHAAGGSLEQVVKVSIYLADMELFAEVNEVYGGFFPPPYPARACFAVKELPKKAGIELEAIALLD